MEWWHKRVVEGYRRRHKICEGNGAHGGWWSEEIPDDLYIHANLARHLAESGKVDELEMLLLDYR